MQGEDPFAKYRHPGREDLFMNINLNERLSVNKPKIEGLPIDKLVLLNDYVSDLFQFYQLYKDLFFDESSAFRQVCDFIREERRLHDLLVHYFPEQNATSTSDIRFLFRTKKLTR